MSLMSLHDNYLFVNQHIIFVDAQQFISQWCDALILWGFGIILRACLLFAIWYCLCMLQQLHGLLFPLSCQMRFISIPNKLCTGRSVQVVMLHLTGHPKQTVATVVSFLNESHDRPGRRNYLFRRATWTLAQVSLFFFKTVRFSVSVKSLYTTRIFPTNCDPRKTTLVFCLLIFWLGSQCAPSPFVQAITPFATTPLRCRNLCVACMFNKTLM